jgi:hypothetical protein
MEQSSPMFSLFGCAYLPTIRRATHKATDQTALRTAASGYMPEDVEAADGFMRGRGDGDGGDFSA